MLIDTRISRLPHRPTNVSSTGSYGNQQPRGPDNARSSRRSGRGKPVILDKAFDDVIRGKRQKLGPGHFDDTGVWVPAIQSSRSEELLSDLSRREDSFGKSLLKTQGLFGRKRREGAGDDRGAVLNKSGRFTGEPNGKPADVKGGWTRRRAVSTVNWSPCCVVSTWCWGLMAFVLLSQLRVLLQRLLLLLVSGLFIEPHKPQGAARYRILVYTTQVNSAFRAI